MPAPPPRELAKPKPGYYSMRFVKGGPNVPVLIEYVTDANKQDELHMQATVDGKRLGYAYSEAELESEAMIWLMGGRPKEERTPADRLLINIMLANPIDAAEYERMLELRRTTPPWHPCHHPYQKIDLSKLPALGRKW